MNGAGLTRDCSGCVMVSKKRPQPEAEAELDADAGTGTTSNLAI